MPLFADSVKQFSYGPPPNGSEIRTRTAEIARYSSTFVTSLSSLPTGGEAVGEELTNRLQQELAFWQTTAPSLSPGWWNQDPAPHAPLRERYSRTFQLVLGLERMHYTPALITAKNLGNLWHSLPQLNDPSGLNQSAQECDQLVDQLRAN
jgi:hypothetical protein